MAELVITGQVADTLTAVAAVDDSKPHELASMIVADWLATHHHRFRAAAEALGRLFPDAPSPMRTSDNAQAERDWATAIARGIVYVTPEIEAQVRRARDLLDGGIPDEDLDALQRLVDESPDRIDGLAVSCPRCGGPATVEMIDDGGDPPRVMPGTITCAAACEAREFATGGVLTREPGSREVRVQPGERILSREELDEQRDIGANFIPPDVTPDPAGASATPDDHPYQEDDHAPLTEQHTAHDDVSGEGAAAGVSDPAPEADAASFITDALGHACDHDGCTFVAKNANGLAIHRGRKHPETRAATPAADETPWSCCGRSFRSPQALGAHRRHRHPNRDTEADTEPAHTTTHNDTPNHPSDPLLDAPRVPVELHTCEVCRSRVPSVTKVRGIGDCCRDCAKAAR